MTTTTTIEEQVETAIAFLRQVGREAEARAVSVLLDERRPDRRQAAPTQPDELVPIAEAARLIGTSRKGVMRRIASGLLIGEQARNGAHFVTRTSLERFLNEQQQLARIAAPIAGVEGTGWNASSQVGQMFAKGLAALAELERAELAEEAATVELER